MPRLRLWWILSLGLMLSLDGTAASVQVVRQNYRGWSNSLVMGNGLVEVVVVPEVGRVMQFRRVGQTNGPFWENEKLLGKPMPDRPWEVAHGSFGGDKTWPAPQSAWNWPPPDVFDATPVQAQVRPDQSVVLTSPVSPRFGLRTQRRLVLDPTQPVLHIETTYEKVTGEPMEVSVWVITQMRSPEAMFLPIPAGTRFPLGSSTNWGIPEAQFQRVGSLARFTRAPDQAHKVGNDGESMVWVGPTEVVRIDLPRKSDAAYPDGGCSVEIYTNPDPVPYVELETLGPLQRLRAGESLSATNRYRLEARQETDPGQEARRILAR